MYDEAARTKSSTSRKTTKSGTISSSRCLMTRIWSCGGGAHCCTHDMIRHRQHLGANDGGQEGRESGETVRGQ